ncbi:MAG TPA: hypothetical protein VJO34_03270 [Methylomirabilota bacterium]|nr:hypothetical protein [Methylomirabilota bacterium]
MNKSVRLIVAALVVLALAIGSAWAQDKSDSAKAKAKVDAATMQVETGAKKIGDGEIGEGVEQLAKGIGNTVVEGAKFTGEKMKDAGKAAEPPAKHGWEKVKDGAVSFGTSVKKLFARLFSD